MPYFESCVSFFISCCCSISVRMVGRWCVKSNNNNKTFVNACRPHSKHSTDILQRVWVHVGIKFQGRIRALSDTIPGPTIPNEKNNRRETINFGAWTCNFFFQFDCPCYCSPVQYVMIRWYDTMIGVESSQFVCYQKSFFLFFRRRWVIPFLFFFFVLLFFFLIQFDHHQCRVGMCSLPFSFDLVTYYCVSFFVTLISVLVFDGGGFVVFGDRFLGWKFGRRGR